MSLPMAEPTPLTTAKAELGDRSLFPRLQAKVYANHAAISPPSEPVREAVMGVADLMGSQGVAAIGRLLAQRARLKESLAELMGGTPSELGLVLNTTAGLTAIALCFPWNRGDRVAVFSGEFPTNVTPWQRAAELFGLEVVYLPVSDMACADGPDFTKLDEALAGGVTLLAMSAVQFQTGLRMPIESIVQRCSQNGTQVCVDGIQAVGSMPFDVAELGIDYLACGGHKWMMGPEGAGFVWAREDRAAALKPHLAGWLSHEEPVDFLFAKGLLRYDKPIRASMDFVESGVPNGLGYAGLEASVHLIAQVGPERIASHIQAWHDALEPALVERGFTSLRHKDSARRSGILSAEPPGKLSALQVVGALGARGVACTTPDGLVRFAPHWPNSLDEVPLVIAALDDALSELRAD